jgi:glycosyltransferase involved in cell wall biosynthesis
LSDLPRLLLCSFDVIPGPSGSSRRLTEYLKALPDRFSVVVLSAKTPDHSHIEKYQGARLLRVPVGTGDLPSRIQVFERAVRRQLESEEYAIAHFTDPFGGYVLCEHKGDYGYRLIYDAQTFASQELRDTHPQHWADKRFLSKVRRQELYCLLNADLVLTSAPTTRAFMQSLGVEQDSVRLVRAPVDLGPYTPEAVGLPDGTPLRLMYLGSQVAWQGLPGLLRGLALARREVDARLTVVGPSHPDVQPQLEKLIGELGLQAHVELQPPVVHDDVVKVLALSDVCVLPLEDVDRNRLQGGPLAKVSEYFAAGRPVIAADLPVARELIPETTGVFYPPGDAQALADHIIALARDVPRRLTLGRQARAFAQQVLDAGIIRGQLLDIYDSLLLGKPVPSNAPSEPLPLPTVTGTPTALVQALTDTGNTSVPAPAPAPATTAPDAKKPEQDEAPMVMGQVLQEDDSRLVKTELEVRPGGPPVVMGRPLRDFSLSELGLTEPDARPGGPPVVMGLPLRETPPPTKHAPTPPEATRVEPPAPATPEPPAPAPAEPPAALSAEPPTPEPLEAQAAPPPEPPAAEPAKPPQGTGPSPSPLPAPTAPGVSDILEELAPSAPASAAPPPQKGRQESSASAVLDMLEELVPSLPAPAPTRPPALPTVREERAATRPSAEPPLLRPAEEPRPRAPEQASSRPSEPPMLRPVEPPSLPEKPRPSGPPALPPRASATGIPAVPTRPSSPAIPPLPPRASSSGIPPLPPRASSPGMPALPTRPSSPGFRPVTPPVLSPQPPPPSPPPLAARAPAPRESLEEPEELAESEVEELSTDARSPSEEPEEISSEDIQEAEAAAPSASGPATREKPVREPLASRLNPWFAQLAHGYCPPEGAQFARHTPPTTFPGRDEAPEASRSQPASPRPYTSQPSAASKLSKP